MNGEPVLLLPLFARLEPSVVATLVFIGVISFTLLMRSQRYFRRQRPDPLPSILAKQRPAAISKPPADIDRWQVQMHDLARDLSAQLDSKLSALQYLVNLADERIAELQALTAALSSTGTQAERLAQSAVHMPPTKPETRAAEIYALSDAGKSSQAIAALIGAPVGEVELMLGLRATR